jgi:DNA-binding CsgD family transcriptional regulator
MNEIKKNNEIAAYLGVSLGTVSYLRKQVKEYEKINSD